MKPLKTAGLIMLSLCLLMGCAESFDGLEKDQDELMLKRSHTKPKTVTVPFKANFTVLNYSDPTDVSCGGFPILFLTMKGNGNINHLGKISTKMTFCCEVTTGHYYNTIGWFAAANGDTLFFEIPDGWIVKNLEDNSDYYQKKFNDPMLFTGGTGRFKGATGEAMTKAYVHDVPEEWHTDFFSTGDLVLVKGKLMNNAD